MESAQGSSEHKRCLPLFAALVFRSARFDFGDYMNSEANIGGGCYTLDNPVSKGLACELIDVITMTPGPLRKTVNARGRALCDQLRDNISDLKARKIRFFDYLFHCLATPEFDGPHDRTNGAVRRRGRRLADFINETVEVAQLLLIFGVSPIR
jgi:hypothetical protein